jgi:hypothetical protein
VISINQLKLQGAGEISCYRRVVLPVVKVAIYAVDNNNSTVTTHISVTITSTTAAIVTSTYETGSDWPPVPVFVPRWLGTTRKRIHTFVVSRRTVQEWTK